MKTVTKIKRSIEACDGDINGALSYLYSRYGINVASGRGRDTELWYEELSKYREAVDA